MKKIVLQTILILALVFSVDSISHANAKTKQFEPTVNITVNEDVTLSTKTNEPICVKITSPQNALIAILINGVVQKDAVLYRPDDNSIGGYAYVESISDCDYIYLFANTDYYYLINPTSDGQIVLKCTDLLQDAVLADGTVSDTLVPNFRQVYKYPCHASSKYSYNVPKLTYDKKTTELTLILLDEDGHYGIRRQKDRYYGDLFCTGCKGGYVYVLVEPKSLMGPASFSLDLSSLDEWNIKVKKKSGRKLTVVWEEHIKKATYTVLVSQNKEMTKPKTFSCKKPRFTKILKSGTYYIQVKDMKSGQMTKPRKIKIK